MNDTEPLPSRQRILAVASCGGHWRQLLKLRGAWAECDVAYVSVGTDRAADVAGSRYHGIQDSSRANPLAVLRSLHRIWRILRSERPDTVVSTGAAPGFLALTLARLYGAKTVWIDSAANSDRMSLSGRLAKWSSDLWLTQWPHLAKARGPAYAGSVL